MTREEINNELDRAFEVLVHCGHMDMRRREAFYMAIQALSAEPCDSKNEVMNFPETWEEYEEYYGFNDTKEVYSNNIRLIPSFRVKQWLEHLKTEPCEDCISRQATLEPYRVLKDTDTLCVALIRANIKQQPSVTPKPKMGHWIDDTSLGYHVSICSNCDWRGHGDTCLIYKPKYCPNCGAKMAENPTGSKSEDTE